MTKPLRVFDVDFTEISQTVTRVGAASTGVAGYNDLCESQLILDDGVGGAIFYEAIDLSQLTLEGKTFQPMQVMVNRPYNVPRGSMINPNPTVQKEEYIFIWYSNTAYPRSGLTAGQMATFIQGMRAAGMNTSPLIPLDTAYEEEQPNLSQLLWASSAAFLPSLDTSVSVPNGFLDVPAPLPPPNKTVLLTNSFRQVDSSEWGSMLPVQGPMLHVMRMITDYSQNMSGIDATTELVVNNGGSYTKWAPLNVKIICQEVDLGETEYLATAYNTLMRQMPAGAN